MTYRTASPWARVGVNVATAQHSRLLIASSEFERVLDGGFCFLRFPPALEAQYLQDKAAERLKMIRVGMVLVLFLSNAMLLPDWLLRDPPLHILTAMTISMVATAAFTLYGCYWLEHEDRSNWLMAQHESLLLRELDHANQRLEHLARFDPLTDLANRRHFDEFAAQAWGRAQRDGHDLAVL